MSSIVVILSYCQITPQQAAWLKTRMAIAGGRSSYVDHVEATTPLPPNWYLFNQMSHENALDLAQGVAVITGIHGCEILVANVDDRCRLSLGTFAQRTLH
jgi:hypothetical protein